MGQYSIKDVEQLTGVKAHTLRIWEQRYQTVQPHRTETNIRYYDDEQLRFLINVALLLKHGRKVSKIFQLTGEQMHNEIKNLRTATVSSDKYDLMMVDRLVLSMIDLDEVEFDRILTEVVVKYGFEDTMLKVIIPFLEKVGVLWATGEVNVAQEHFISNLIRRKLMVAIDGLDPVVNTDAKKFILFLPEGELHEIGLLLAQYMIKRRGHKVIYLGQSVPMEDLTKVHEVYKADVLLTYFTIHLENQGVVNCLQGLMRFFGDRKVMLCGPVANELALSLPRNFQKVSTIPDLAGLLN